MAKIKQIKPVVAERAAQRNEVKEEMAKEIDKPDPQKQEKILVKLKENAARLKKLEEIGAVAKFDVEQIERELNTLIEKFEGIKKFEDIANVENNF